MLPWLGEHLAEIDELFTPIVGQSQRGPRDRH
jgi:hypothetical protein